MRGAYGFELVGAEADSDRRSGSLFVAIDPGSPTLAVTRVTGDAGVTVTAIGADQAQIELVAGGCIRLTREPLAATFTTVTPLSDDALAHPYLAPAAAVAAYWLRREALHAGAIELPSGAWGIVAAKEGGKSSLLAALAQAGVAVLSDDALVVEGETAFAGPRSIDLRAESAARVPASESLGRVGDRERFRLRLPQVAGTARLRGFVHLSWGDTLALEPLAAADRLGGLLAHRIVKGLPPPDADQLLALSALPGFELRRPRAWSRLDAAAELLVDELSSL